MSKNNKEALLYLLPAAAPFSGILLLAAAAEYLSECFFLEYDQP